MVRPLLSRVMLFVIVLGSCCLAQAQVVRIQAGTSTVLDADGASMDFRSQNYAGSFGLGFVDGAFHYGANVETKLGDNTMKLGDDQVHFELPTDVFDASHYFLVRGVGLGRKFSDGTAWVFTGVSSRGFNTPFFGAADNADGIGALFYEKRLSEHVTFFSRNIFSDRQTMIQAGEWRPSSGVRAAVAIGTGNNARYEATSLMIERKRFDLKTSYVSPSEHFLRLRAPTAELASEVEGPNASLTYRPRRGFAVTVTHQNIVQPGVDSEPSQHASVNELFATGTAAKTSFGGGLFTTQAFGRTTTGTAFFAGRNLTSRVSVTGNYFRSAPDLGKPSATVSANTRVAVTQRLSVLQVIARANGSITNSFGGEYTGNRFNAQLDYQTVFLPLRPDKPFEQAMSFNASVNLFAGLRAIAGSNIAADGHLRYTFGISRYFYRMAPGGDVNAAAYHFGKYVVTGVVVDAAGQPFAGAAVVIGKDTVYSDDDGKFLLRVNRRAPLQVKVNFDEFITPGDFELVSGPSTAMPEAEDAPGAGVRIALRRKPRSTAASNAPPHT